MTEFDHQSDYGILQMKKRILKVEVIAIEKYDRKKSKEEVEEERGAMRSHSQNRYSLRDKIDKHILTHTK